MAVCEQHNGVVKDIETIQKKLNGNGRPGLLERVGRLEAKQAMLIWIGGMMAGGLISLAFKVLIGG